MGSKERKLTMHKKIIVYYDEDPDAITQFKINTIYDWDNHINYTRDAIISILHNVGDTSAIVSRLMKNQEDIGHILVPYYGNNNATLFTNLLKEHVSLTADIVNGIKSNSNIDQITNKWRENASAIATLLAKLDPHNWPQQITLKKLNEHLDHTLQNIYAQHRHDWGADLAEFDVIHKSIFELANYISEGIIDRYPEHFVRYTDYTPPIKMVDYTKDK